MSTLRFLPWDWPADDWTPRHHVSSIYVETYWLPILGPSSVMLGRRVGQAIPKAANGQRSAVIDRDLLGRMLGIGQGNGRQIDRVVARLAMFKLATVEDPDAVAIRLEWPELHEKQVRRLPDPLRALHHAEHGSGLTQRVA